MNRKFYTGGFLWVGLLGLPLSVGAAPAQNPLPLMQPAVTRTPPQVPFALSPIDSVRRILDLAPAEREKFLAGRNPEHRRFLEAKFIEYDQLSPSERETRLQTLQLRYYFANLIKLPLPQRAGALAFVPESERPLVEERLSQWDRLRPDQQRAVLDYENSLRLTFQSDSGGLVSPPPLSKEQRAEVDKQLIAWNGLPVEKRREIQSHFQRFFTLPGTEKVRTLGAMGAAERRTLLVIGKMPAKQRQQCLDGLQKLAVMAPGDRHQFLRTAARWQTMSEEQRQSWRQVASKLPANFPLPPPLSGPPVPPGFTARPSSPKDPALETNR